MFDFIDWFFNIELGNLSKEPKEVWSGTPRKQFTLEQREYLDKIKSLAVDVEYEEIQS